MRHRELIKAQPRTYNSKATTLQPIEIYLGEELQPPSALPKARAPAAERAQHRPRHLSQAPRSTRHETAGAGASRRQAVPDPSTPTPRRHPLRCCSS